MVDGYTRRSKGVASDATRQHAVTGTKKRQRTEEEPMNHTSTRIESNAEDSDLDNEPMPPPSKKQRSQADEKTGDTSVQEGGNNRRRSRRLEDNGENPFEVATTRGGKPLNAPGKQSKSAGASTSKREQGTGGTRNRARPSRRHATKKEFKQVRAPDL